MMGFHWSGLVPASCVFQPCLLTPSRYPPCATGVQVDQQRQFGPDCTLRTLALTCSSTGATHTLSHYHFHAWPDHGTPDSSSGIRAICSALAPARETGRPIVVHCSAVSEWRNGERL
jgi:hypothetical protein